MCRELHIPPRSGGLLDQPADEIVLLQKVYEAEALHQKRVDDWEETKNKNKSRGHRE